MKRLFPLSIFLWLQLVAFGQNCGLESTIRLPANTVDTIDLPIFDLINDSLSSPDQGVCSIDLSFIHHTVGSFEVILISPAGQEVQLIGPNASTPVSGLGFRYDVTFLSERLGQLPDNGQWDNDFPNPGRFDPIVGTFFPFSGSLRDFDIGSVNGTWKLVVRTNNAVLPIDGLLTDVKINFCDDLGENCCFSEGGAFARDSTLVICAGDPSLQLLPLLDSTITPADATEYDYTYLLTQADEIIAVDSLANWQALPPGTYNMYGLSYAMADRDSLPRPATGVLMDTLRSQLSLPEPPFCGDLTTNFWVLTIAEPVDTVFISQTICGGDSIAIGDTILASDGIYVIDLTDGFGCDSTVVVDLSIDNPVTTIIDTILCAGDSLELGGMFYELPGVYRDTLATFAGCDSIVVVNLDVANPTRDTISQIVCNGQSVSVGGQSFNSSGLYTVTLTGASGCDSVVVLDLTVLSPMAMVDAGPRSLTCNDPTLLLDGRNALPQSGLTYRWERQRDGELFVDVVGTDSTLLVDQSATFFLQVGLTVDGVSCSSRTGPIEITADTIPPLVEAGPDRSLNCIQETAVLGSGLVTGGPGVDISWTAAVGVFPGDANVTRPVVTSAGKFFLRVTNTDNGCFAVDSVEVVDWRRRIEVALPADTAITCNESVLRLSGEILPDSLDYTFSWYVPGQAGMPLSDSVSFEADQAGDYVLEVTDPFSLCSGTDTIRVGVDTLTPIAVLSDPGPISCTVNAVQIDASSSFLPGNSVGLWTSVGDQDFTQVSDLVIEVNEADTIIFRLENINNGCVDSSIVVVSDLRTPISAVVSSPLVIDCGRPVVRLDASASQPVGQLTYSWSTVDGQILNGAAEAVARVTKAGIYQLEVTDTVNSCSDITLVEVLADTLPPVISLEADGRLHCGNTEVNLSNAIPETSGIMFRYDWLGPCLSDTLSTEQITVNCQGMYQLTVTNLLNACSQTDSILVDSLESRPLALTVRDSLFLDCTSGEVLLDGSPSENGDPLWVFRGAEAGRSPTLLATDTGTYELVISDVVLGCSDTTSVWVGADCIPVAVVESPLPISCSRSAVILDASGSEDGSPLVFEWTGPASSCLQNADGSIIEVSCTGTYQLVVTNTSVGQSDTIQVEVEQDNSLPFVDAGPDQILSCVQASVLLDGSASAVGPEISYIWRNDAGDTVSTTTIWDVAESGTYFLEVIDATTGCRSEDVAVVAQDADLPDIRFGSRFFPCDEDTLFFPAVVLPTGIPYEYSWTGTEIIGSTSDSVVALRAPGDLSLEVRNPINDCRVSRTVTIEQQPCGPCLDIPVPDTLTCVKNQVTVEVVLCSPCPSCTYSWRTTSGNIITDPSQAGITVIAPGVYTVRVTDSLGIGTDLSVEVVGDTSVPMVDIPGDRLLDCQTLSVALGENLVPSGDSLRYTWLTASLDTLPLADGRTTIVAVPGTYLLMATDLRNGCTGQDQVVVRQNSNPPAVDAGGDLVLDCESPILRLDGTGSSEGVDITYQWRTIDGVIRAGDQTLNPLVEGVGTYLLDVTNVANQCTVTDTVRVLPPERFPQLNSLDTLILGCTQRDILLEAPVDPDPDFNYLWRESGGDTVGTFRTINLSNPGSYSLVVTNPSNNCQDSIAFAVEQDLSVPNPELPERDTLRCNQLDVLLSSGLTAAGNLDFSWTTGRGLDLSDQVGPDLRVTESDTVFLTVENLRNGCTGMDTTVVVSTNDRPVIRAPEQDRLSCAVPTIDLRLSLGGDLSDYAFSWSTTDGQIIGDASIMGPTVSEPGRYTLVTTNLSSGCQSELFVQVEADRRLPQAALADLDTLYLTCRTNEVQLDATPSVSATGSGLDYEWVLLAGEGVPGSLTQPILSLTSSSDLLLVVTDQQNGCLDSLFVSVVEDRRVPEPIAFSMPDPLTCTNGNTSLTVNNFSAGLRYYLIDGLDTAILAGPEWLFEAGGSVLLAVENPNNGCRQDTVINVTVDTLTPQLNIEQLGMLGCDNPSVRLRVTEEGGMPLTNVMWSNTAGVQLPNTVNGEAEVGMSGEYRVSADVRDNGCRSQTSIFVSPSGVPIDSLVIEVMLPGCEAGARGSIRVSQVIGGEGPFLYSLSGGVLGTESVFTDLPSGTYTVRVEDSNGCQMEEMVQIDADASQLQVFLGGDRDIFRGDSITIIPEVTGTPESYRWQAGGQLVSRNDRITVSPENTTTYRLDIQSGGGCRATGQVTVFVQESLGVYLPNVFSPSGGLDRNQTFFVQATDWVEEITTLQIYDRWGEKLFERNNIKPNDPTLGWDGTHQGKPMNSGVYVYYIQLRLRGNREEIMKGDITLIR